MVLAYDATRSTDDKPTKKTYPGWTNYQTCKNKTRTLYLEYDDDITA